VEISSNTNTISMLLRVLYFLLKYASKGKIEKMDEKSIFDLMCARGNKLDQVDHIYFHYQNFFGTEPNRWVCNP
jgi:hypothetical protein